MKKKYVIVSILIIVIGIIIGIIVYNTPIQLLDNEMPIENEGLYVDGTDVSNIANAGGVLGSKILGSVMGFAIIGGSFLIDIAIWIIYGVVLLVLKISNNAKKY